MIRQRCLTVLAVVMVFALAGASPARPLAARSNPGGAAVVPDGTPVQLAQVTLSGPPSSLTGRWVEIPGTRLRESPAIPGRSGPWSYGGATDLAGAMLGAWVSGALDEATGEFLLARPGGHGDSAYNGVIALVLTPPMRWVERLAPSTAFPKLLRQQPEQSRDVYADGSPTSCHTYDATVYLLEQQALWSAGCLRWHDAHSAHRTWWWTRAPSAWVQKPSTRPGGYAAASSWWEAGKRVLSRTSGGLIAYNPATDTYTQLIGSAEGSAVDVSALAIDNAGSRVIFTKPWSTRLASVNLTGAAVETLIHLTGDTAGFSNIPAPGLLWDADRKQLVGYGRSADGTRGALYTFDLAGGCGSQALPCRVTRHVPADGVHPPRAIQNGTWKKFFSYKGAYYIISTAQENVWTFRADEAVPPSAPPRGERREGNAIVG